MYCVYGHQLYLADNKFNQVELAINHIHHSISSMMHHSIILTSDYIIALMPASIDADKNRCSNSSKAVSKVNAHY